MRGRKLNGEMHHRAHDHTDRGPVNPQHRTEQHRPADNTQIIKHRRKRKADKTSHRLHDPTDHGGKTEQDRRKCHETRKTHRQLNIRTRKTGREQRNEHRCKRHDGETTNNQDRSDGRKNA